jgi:curved DNA-binding protein
VKDYYKILELHRDATQEEIKKQYRKLARKYHPDVSQEEESTAKFQELQEAYSILKDEQKKALYDRGIDPSKAGARPAGHGFKEWSFHSGDPFTDLHDLFSQMGMNTRREFRRSVAHVRISLEEAYTGTTRTLNDKPFNIPAGVRPGTQLLVDDFIIVVDVLHHHKFKRANDDLLLIVNIEAAEAMIGTKGVFTHIDGTTLQFTIPAGCQHGQVMRLRGKGMPNPEFVGYTGDLLIQIGITMPTELTEEQKASIMSTLGCRDEIQF